MYSFHQQFEFNFKDKFIATANTCLHIEYWFYFYLQFKRCLYDGRALTILYEKETCKYFSISFLYYSFTLKPLQIHFKIQVQLWFDSDCFVELSFTCIFLLEDQYLICFMKMVPGSLLHLLRYLVFEEGTCNIFVSLHF